MKNVNYTDEQILASHAKHSKLTHDPYLKVMAEIIGTDSIRGFSFGSTEVDDFAERYRRLITPALTSKMGLERALKSAMLAKRHEEYVKQADTRLPFDQWFRLDDIIKVIAGLLPPEVVKNVQTSMEDELEALKWWNGLNDADRTKWLNASEGNQVFVKGAWAAYKQSTST
ncbi:hypothetical protein IB233_04455 [Comamonas sp. CMM01]|uniref:hypothetical protein n=1 Tax=Comamonas sp. CMM01 TaxID=2769280 RepID=UPI001787313E|nr:hypothetical protein [Comamonas sp. CMM01]MBD9530888.1 hypothetical protein [Comamonas sp. CMM01]